MGKLYGFVAILLVSLAGQAYANGAIGQLLYWLIVVILLVLGAAIEFFRKKK